MDKVTMWIEATVLSSFIYSGRRSEYMAKGDSCIHEKVRRLCRDINNQFDDRETLQTLVVRLQDALLEEQYGSRAVNITARIDGDDPFDKIMVA